MPRASRKMILPDIETYLLSSADLAASTTRKTMGSLRHLERAGIDLARPRRAAYQAFMARRKRDGRDGPGLRHYARAMRHLLDYHEIVWPHFRLPRSPAPILELVPDHVVDRLMHYGEGPEDSGWREDMEAARFAFNLGFYAAIRQPSEAHDLELTDFDQDNDTLRVWSDKVEQYRLLHLEPWLADIIRDYIDGPRRQIATTRHDELIVRPTGGHWSREGYRMWLGRHGRKLYRRFKVKDMRAWGATYRLLQTDLDVYFVREWLGHAKLSSTEYYLRVAQAELRRRAHAHKVQPLVVRGSASA